jgi:hypothetical protein
VAQEEWVSREAGARTGKTQWLTPRLYRHICSYKRGGIALDLGSPEGGGKPRQSMIPKSVQRFSEKIMLH